MIRIEKINKRFKKLNALQDISVWFSASQVIGLIGPNGSGKTTLIKSILGLVKPDNGSIYCKDVDITESVDYRKHIGYMPQTGKYPDNMKVGQLFRMMKNIRGGSLDEELFYKFKLDTILDKSMRTLSGGTRQKVSAALAFLFDPDIFILDEPTAGLDPIASEILKTKIISEKEKGKLVLITSHVLSDLEEMITHIVYLQDGRLVFNKPLSELQKETGEEKLNKAIALIMKRNQSKDDVTYLKIAN